MAKKRGGNTPVTVGWVVKKSWKTTHRDPKDHSKKITKSHDKVISKRFYSHEAASIFRKVAEDTAKAMPDEIINDGETDVQFFVTEDGGFDDIRAAQ